MAKESILTRLSLTECQLTDLVDDNPSLRGILLGYTAEWKLREYLSDLKEIEYLGKDDDHDRKSKGDLRVRYNGHEFRIESKSLQTNSIKKNLDGTHVGKVQCDASDRRNIRLPDGSTVNTTLLQYGEFDVLASNLFAFENKWAFTFSLNRDLPHTTYAKYTESQQKYLIASLVTVTMPPVSPFTSDLVSLLDMLVNERESSSQRR